MSERTLNELLFEAADKYDLVDILEELDRIYKPQHYVFSFEIDQTYLLNEIERLNEKLTNVGK